VAGAGTLALEFEAQCGGLPDRLLVSVGGGGLVAGIAAWCEGRTGGEPVDVVVSGVAADSLGARRIGDIAWALSQRHVQAVHLLGDAAIRQAQGTLWRELRLLVEPAAALPLAALATGRVQPRRGERVGLVICGANLALQDLAAA
jgi:threonine dehydratase